MGAAIRVGGGLPIGIAGLQAIEVFGGQAEVVAVGGGVGDEVRQPFSVFEVGAGEIVGHGSDRARNVSILRVGGFWKMALGKGFGGFGLGSSCLALTDVALALARLASLKRRIALPWPAIAPPR